MVKFVYPRCHNSRALDESARRAKVPRRITGGHALLTEAQVLELRALRTYHGWSERRLAERYGLSVATARRIVDGITYAKLRYEEPADAAAAIEEHARARDGTREKEKST